MWTCRWGRPACWNLTLAPRAFAGDGPWLQRSLSEPRLDRHNDPVSDGRAQYMEQGSRDILDEHAGGVGLGRWHQRELPHQAWGVGMMPTPQTLTGRGPDLMPASSLRPALAYGSAADICFTGQLYGVMNEERALLSRGQQDPEVGLTAAEVDQLMHAFV